ncbi:MAG TPA: DPP IV N-terminal domain-containing protein [Polyangiaceae bacterium]|nr:DPP IV N-terminal domain-containing protein [Polyangiaceae bacterium]
MLLEKTGFIVTAARLLAALVLAACARRDSAEPAGAAPPAAPAPAAAWPEPDDALLEQLASTLNFALGTPASPWVAPDGAEVIFRRSGSRSFVGDLYAFDVQTGAERPLLTAAALLAGGDEQLSVEERARRERMRQVARGIATFSSDEGGSLLLIPLSGRLFVFERKSGATRELPTPGPALDPRLSPDGRHVAFVSDGDLYVVDSSGKQPPRRLTRRESESIEYGVAEFVAQEEMGRLRGYWWSPDSRRLAYQRSDLSKVERLFIADATHPEREPNAFRYPRVGTANAEVTLGVIGVDGGPTRWVEWDRGAYPYLARVIWQKRAPLTLLVQNRAQTEELVLAVDEARGNTRTLLTERDPAWVNLDGGELPCWTADGRAFLWSSEASGAWELELRSADGSRLRTLVPAALGYQGFAGLDEERGAAWVVASADPRQRHVYRVPLDGTAPERVTQADGEHAVVPSEHGGAAVLISRGADGKRSSVVRRADGSPAGELRSVAEQPSALPAPEHVSVRIDGREHHALVLRPRAFERGRKYPVLLSVYGGPHASMVHSDPYTYLLDQWYADGGFVVVRADGRGTPGHGRDWERAIHQRLASVALDDQVAILRALAAERPELDLDRVGITGWSFGGYMSAMAVLLRPDVFRAAAAGAPVTDWRNYDTHYTERYMGLLAESRAAYDETSAVTHAAKLERPLLLIHGTTDDNVYFTHSLELSQALFRAGKPFEMLPLAGFTHMVPDPIVKKALSRRVLEFFRHNL